MTAAELVGSLESVRARGPNKWSAKCPAHADKSPSLTIAEGDKGLLVKCWAGCSIEEICKAIGIEKRDLFYDARDPNPARRREVTRPAKVNRVARAFQFDLGALDLRLRAEKIIATGKTLDVAHLNDHDLDRALAHVAQAHTDLARAVLFEDVADDLRMKEFLERDHAQNRHIA